MGETKDVTVSRVPSPDVRAGYYQDRARLLLREAICQLDIGNIQSARLSAKRAMDLTQIIIDLRKSPDG